MKRIAPVLVALCLLGLGSPATAVTKRVYLNLNTSVAGINEPADPAAAQAWVAVTMNRGGTFSVGFDAIQIDNATRALHQTPGQP
jgi:hypothetical protein